LRQLVYLNRYGNHHKDTLLHCACYTELDLAAIQLLLKSGAAPNARDYGGNGPLHVLAREHKFRDVVMIETVARLLLENGAHLHMVNEERDTPADVWLMVNKNEAEAPPDNEALPVLEAAVLPDLEISLPEWLREPERIPMLSCLCARVIRPFLIAYKKCEDLPATLGDFIEWH